MRLQIWQFKLAGVFRSCSPEVFLRKSVLKIYSRFTGEHPCRSVISIKLLCNFIEITLRHGCSPVNLLHVFRTPFTKNTFGWLLLFIQNLKALRNCIPRIICVWSLICSIRVGRGLHFLPILLENCFFLSFWAFCVFSLFWVNLI